MNHITKQGFYKMLSEENSVFGRSLSLISTYSISISISLSLKWVGLEVGAYLCLIGRERGVVWGGRLFEAGRLLTFSAFGMGA